ncbi:MAG TPA: glycosyltransferase [Desulfomonilaceae bacterium]|nr:glycosyltransferase [Desulfomonilaceae bacterium]
MKTDLHVHSKYSRRPSEWILKKLGCPESFTDPMHLYSIAKKRGMSLVTITDHNTIDGCLEIAHLPDTFVSEEVTTYFPGDGCKLHVLVYNIDEEMHADIQKVRENVFDLTAYLRQQKITHVLAHPLFPVNRTLTIDHFEKCLLLFKNFELNGARSEEQNRCMQLVLSILTPEKIDELAEKHQFTTSLSFPWIKNLAGGSDDHSSLTIARRYTEIDEATGTEDFLRGVEEGKATVAGPGSSPKTLAHNVYGVAYQFYEHKFDLKRYVNSDVIFKFLDRFLQVDQSREPGFLARLHFYWNHGKKHKAADTADVSVLALLRQETHRLIRDDPQLSEIFKNGNGNRANLDDKWFHFVNKVSNKVLMHFTDHVMDSLSGAHFLNVFHSLGSAGALYSVLAPYFVAFSIFSEDRQFGKGVLQSFIQEKQDRSRHVDTTVAHFTDTFYEVNGVAGTLKRQVEAARRAGKKYCVITCDPGNRASERGIRNFKPIGAYEISVYPEQKLFYPPVLEILDYCYNEAFTHIHSATPGPLGLAALAIARILKLPLVGTYHTALPQYAQYLTEDASITELIWKYVLWYYDQMDLVYVPSKSTADELEEKGISSHKIRVFPRGVDTVRFDPAKRNGCLDKGCAGTGTLRVLYVGRISKEKNVQILVNAFRSLAQSKDNVVLVVVGDGPYREEMERALKGTPSLFLGYVEGETLASVYASCDLFVFPSTTDTFGNVVLEAQASGLPVLVTDRGGPQENLVRGVTGIVVKGDCENSLLEGMRTLLSDPLRLKQMGKAARAYAGNRSFDRAFTEAWELYGEAPNGGAHTYQAPWNWPWRTDPKERRSA